MTTPRAPRTIAEYRKALARLDPSLGLAGEVVSPAHARNLLLARAQRVTDGIQRNAALAGLDALTDEEVHAEVEASRADALNRLRELQGVPEHMSNTQRGVLRAAVRWAFAEAGLDEEGIVIGKRIKSRYEQRRVKRYPASTQVEAFALEAAKAREPFNHLLRMLLSLGLRAEELAMLHREEIERAVAQHTLTFTRKGGHEAVLPVTPGLAPTLRALLKRPRLVEAAQLDVPAGPWARLWEAVSVSPAGAYQRIYKVVGRVGERVDTALNWTPHMLRHCFATEMIRRGAPPNVVQRALGHASVLTTLRTYVHVDVQDLAKWMGDSGSTEGLK